MGKLLQDIVIKKGNKVRSGRAQNWNPLVLSKKKENGFDLISDDVSTPSSEDSFCLAVRIVLRCSIGANVNDRCAAPAFPWTLSEHRKTAEI